MNSHLYRTCCYLLLFTLILSGTPALAESSTREFTIFRVELETAQENSAPEKRIKDFYINGGRDDGLSQDMILDVYRKKTVRDINRGENLSFSVHIGELIVDNIYKDVSTTRLVSLTSSQETPILEYRAIMIGDYAVPRMSKKEDEGLGILFPSDILFSLNKWALKPEAKKSLSAVFDMFNKTKERTIIIEGHTCSLGKEKKNMELSKQRAQSVADYLKKEKNIPADKIKIKSYGQTLPIASNKTAEGRAKNRRVVIRFQKR